MSSGNLDMFSTPKSRARNFGIKEADEKLSETLHCEITQHEDLRSLPPSRGEQFIHLANGFLNLRSPAFLLPSHLAEINQFASNANPLPQENVTFEINTTEPCVFPSNIKPEGRTKRHDTRNEHIQSFNSAASAIISKRAEKGAGEGHHYFLTCHRRFMFLCEKKGTHPVTEAEKGAQMYLEKVYDDFQTNCNVHLKKKRGARGGFIKVTDQDHVECEFDERVKEVGPHHQHVEHRHFETLSKWQDLGLLRGSVNDLSGFGKESNESFDRVMACRNILDQRNILKWELSDPEHAAFEGLPPSKKEEFKQQLEGERGGHRFFHLKAMKGSYTRLHIDSAGSSTLISCPEGLKLFFISMPDLQEVSKLGGMCVDGFLESSPQIYYFFLPSGFSVFMPAFTVHAVIGLLSTTLVGSHSILPEGSLRLYRGMKGDNMNELEHCFANSDLRPGALQAILSYINHGVDAWSASARNGGLAHLSELNSFMDPYITSRELFYLVAILKDGAVNRWCEFLDTADKNETREQHAARKEEDEKWGWAVDLLYDYFLRTIGNVLYSVMEGKGVPKPDPEAQDKSATILIQGHGVTISDTRTSFRKRWEDWQAKETGTLPAKENEVVVRKDGEAARRSDLKRTRSGQGRAVRSNKQYKWSAAQD